MPTLSIKPARAEGIRAGTRHGCTVQIVNAGDSLARAAVRDDAGEPLGAGMKRQKMRACPIGDRQFGGFRF